MFTLKLNEAKSLDYLEHVVSVITLQSGIRGKLKIILTSPAKTKSNLLEFREHDMSRSGFNSWPFMSVHYWGESLEGDWQLEIINDSDLNVVLKEWHLKCYGTKSVNKAYEMS